MLRRTAAGWAALLVIAWGASARADNPAVSVQLFRPTPFPNHYLHVRGVDLPPHLTFSGGATFAYGSRPLAFVQGDRSHAVVAHQATLDLLASASFFDRFGLGLALPLFLFQRGEDGGFVPIDSYESFSVGDLRISPAVVLLPHRGRGFGLALDLTLSVPTAQDGRFAGDAGVTFAPRLIAEVAFPRIRAALDLGYLVRRNQRVFGAPAGDRLLLDVAAAGTLWPGGLEAFGELQLATPAADPFASAHADQMEGRLGLGYRFPQGWQVRLAAGGGFLEGWGTPEWRLALQVGFDRALAQAGPVAVVPAEGLPHEDDDADGLTNAADRCVADPEDRDGFQDDDGCPDPDNDADGVIDVADGCRDEAEDRDGFEDGDGCPDRDDDGDGLPDVGDRCPREPETPNGLEDDDGCPDAFPVAVEDGHLVLRDPVRFSADDRRRLDPVSFDALEQLARFLLEHPEIGAVSVEAHTDSEGEADANLALTQAQAQAIVDHLVALDVAAERLAARGFGEERPIASNTDEWGREANRRVEFRIGE